MKFVDSSPTRDQERSSSPAQAFRADSSSREAIGQVDRRQSQAAQRRLSGMADTSEPVMRQMALNARADESTRVVAQAKLRDSLGAAQLVEEEELKGKGAATAQMAVADELEAPGSGTTAQRAKDDELAQRKRASPVQRQEPNRTGLPDQLKSGVENLSGMSMDHVKVHYNSPQPAQLNALAYAQGSDIHVAPGQEKHVPHEAWHVVQQAQGRVQPTTQMKEGTPVNNDPNLEHEADVMGAKALQMRVGPAAWRKSNK
ncbi:MAG TPA: DUF4157 domain-containing protein [Burkholderiaceae bacterium]|jgi:hypothetical protein